MISIRLRNIFLFSIPLFIVHGIEEYLTEFYKVDDILFGRLNQDIAQPAFATFQIVWWILLIIVGFKLISTKWGFRLMFLVGIVYVFEFHHLIRALFIEKSYYSGTVTALAFPIVAVFFWKEFLKNRQNFSIEKK